MLGLLSFLEIEKTSVRNRVRRKMINAIGIVFGYLIELCYKIIPSYGWAIILFTFLTKIILLPISILVQLNSIKMVKMYPEMNRIKAKFFGSNDLISEANYELYKKEKYHPMLDLVPVIVQLVVLMGVVEGLKKLQVPNTYFCGMDFGVIPYQVLGISIIVPVLAALSAWLMCVAQNKSNVLQSEQSKANKITTLSISVGLSLYLGFFVTAGVGLYWIAGNILAIVQLYILNACISPKKHIDYEALAESKAELDKVLASNASAKAKVSKEDQIREKADYKRFDKYGAKQLVFYAERNGFYKYFKDVMEYILAKTDITIHYITSDPKDEILKKESEQFRTYYIGENKLIVTFMKMDADIVVMTTPDLQTYHLKRSIVRDDIEYIYMDHAMGDVNLSYRKHALDHFDTIFVPNDLTVDEIRAQEKTYNLPEKKLVKTGYALIDNMIAAHEKDTNKENEVKEILIAPSWQQDNMLDLCIDEVLDQILGRGYHVTLRPHPQYVRHCESKLIALKEKYSECDDFTLQTDFSSNSTVFNADVMMTDWSGIAYEYSFTTLKPTLYINTPMKIMNPDYEEIGIEPFDIVVRDEVGISVDTDKLGTLGEVVDKLLNGADYSKEAMAKVRDRYLYNIGKSGQVGATYIIKRLIEMTKK